MNKNGYEKVGKKKMEDNESKMPQKITYKNERFKFSGIPKEFKKDRY